MINTLPKSLIDAARKILTESSTHIDVDGEMKHRYNSDGKLIHHTDEGIRNFHRWFGDSKVVDKHGRPKVMYHGTRCVEKESKKHDVAINTFKCNSNLHWFSDNTTVSDIHAGKLSDYSNGSTIPVYIKANNHFDATKLPSNKVKNPHGIFNDELESQSLTKNKKSLAYFKSSPEMSDKFKHPETDDKIAKYWDSAEQTKHFKNLGFDSIKSHMSFPGYYDSPTIGVFHPSQIKSAIGNDGTFDHPTKISESVSDYPQEAVIGRLKDAVNSGRYDIVHHEEDDNYHHFHAVPKKSDNAIEFKEREGKHPSWYDPEIAHVHTPHPEDAFPRTYPKLKSDSGYHLEPQDTKTHGVIYRGMSQEEFDNIKKTGKIQSHGEYNMDGQEHLTYYSKSPSQAQSYSHSFAPTQFKASGHHNAYIVAVKDPGTDVKITGTGEDEVGIPHPIDAKDILHVHVGRAYSGSPGSYSIHKGWHGLEESSSTTPQAYVGWKKMSFDEASK
jgi:hypothetical protein